MNTNNITRLNGNNDKSEFYNRVIAINLMALRTENCFTKERLANSLRIDVEEYIALEEGEKEIPVSLIPKIAAALNIPVELLFTGTEYI